MFVGPVLRTETGKFIYNTFTLEEGIKTSFNYPRIDQAYYSRNYDLKSEGSVALETEDAFLSTVNNQMMLLPKTFSFERINPC